MITKILCYRMRTLQVSFPTMMFQIVQRLFAQTLISAHGNSHSFAAFCIRNQGYRLGGACSTQLESHEFGTRISGPIAVAWWPRRWCNFQWSLGAALGRRCCLWAGGSPHNARCGEVLGEGELGHGKDVGTAGLDDSKWSQYTLWLCQNSYWKWP